eukprot:760988-Amphidinium_carterae.1
MGAMHVWTAHWDPCDNTDDRGNFSNKLKLVPAKPAMVLHFPCNKQHCRVIQTTVQKTLPNDPKKHIKNSNIN